MSSLASSAFSMMVMTMSEQGSSSLYERMPGREETYLLTPDIVVMRFAEILMEQFTAMYPESSDPTDMNIQSHADGNTRTETLMPVFDYLLERFHYLKCDITERLYLFDSAVRYGNIARIDKHGNVTSQGTAIVLNPNSGSLLINLNDPMVFDLITSDLHRTVSERVCVATYLVSVACQFVGRAGFPVCKVRELVGLLGELVRSMRLEYGNDTAHDTAQAADDTDGQGDKIPHGHAVDSTHHSERTGA